MFFIRVLRIGLRHIWRINGITVKIIADFWYWQLSSYVTQLGLKNLYENSFFKS